MSRLLRNERGWAVVTAMLVMALMLSIGLAMFSFVDTETKQSYKERNAESSFDYSESVLSVEGYQVSANWPQASPGMPDCTFNGSTVTAAGGGGNVAL